MALSLDALDHEARTPLNAKRARMAIPYTSGRWRVHTGREHDFIAAWQDLGEWTAENIEGGTWAKLIESRDDPRDFISFGPWRDDEAITQWRTHPGFRERVGKIQQLLESFEPGVFNLVAEIGPSTPDPR